MVSLATYAPSSIQPDHLAFTVDAEAAARSRKLPDRLSASGSLPVFACMTEHPAASGAPQKARIGRGRNSEGGYMKPTAVRTVYIPAVDKRVTLRAYVGAIKAAKANPDRQFAHGLTCWWPCTGEEIMRQFRRSMHDRINQAVPYHLRGMEA